MIQVAYKMPVLFVDDIETSKRFYRNLLGLDVMHDFGENIVFRDAVSLWQRQRAETIIHGAPRKQPSDTDKPVELYFETDDITALWQQLQRSDVDVIHGLKEEPWGQRTCRIYDPDRYILEIAEPMEAVVRRLASADMNTAAIARKTQLDEDAVARILRAQQ